MNLPELPSEETITKWVNSLKIQIGRYVRTFWLALRSPTSLVRHTLDDLTKRETKTQISPLPFILLTLIFASLLQDVAIRAVGVDKPFFDHLSYFARLMAFQHTLTSLQKSLPAWVSILIVLSSLKFAISLLVIVFWARVVAGSTRRYWTDVTALLYLLPIALIADILAYCAINLIFRIIGESALLFAAATLLIGMLSTFIVYGIILRVIDQVFFSRGWRRVINLIAYVMVVPVLLFILQTTIYVIPVGFYAYQVINPMMEGDRKLHSGDYEAAEKLYIQAIQNDAIGFWSGGARMRLISLNAHRILSLLPNLSYDSVLLERLQRNLLQIDPYRRVDDLWRGPIKPTHKQLVELRDAILNSYVSTDDIPITNSELDCALRPTAAEDGCNELSKEDIAGYTNTLVQRQRLYYKIYRARALKGEPITLDARQYLKFLAALPIRIELIFVRYHALNLMRDGKTLAHFDDDERLWGILDRDQLMRGNREILDQGAKYPHLKLPDAQIEKLSDRELGFLFRQTYLNYLRAEARLLAASRVCRESSLIGQRTASIEEQLNWAAKDVIYREIPPVNRIDQDLLKLLGLNSSKDGGLREDH